MALGGLKRNWGANARLVGEREGAEIRLESRLREDLRELELAIGFQQVGGDVGEFCG